MSSRRLTVLLSIRLIRSQSVTGVTIVKRAHSNWSRADDLEFPSCLRCNFLRGGGKPETTETKKGRQKTDFSLLEGSKYKSDPALFN